MSGSVFSRWPKWAIYLLAVLLSLTLGVFDFLTGPNLSFSLFYLAPVLLATWYVDRSAGIVIAVLCAMLELVRNLLLGTTPAQPFVPYWNTGTRLGVFLTVLLLAGETKTRLLLAESLAMTDALTGISNSRNFYRLAELELARAERHNDPISLAYIDLDNFKELNDQRGHNEGDKALQLVASILQHNSRKIDVVARLGGDEFVVLLPETNRRSALEVMLRIQQALLRGMQEGRYAITFSIGIITFSRPPVDVADMIRAADNLMYSVKDSGGNAVRHEMVPEAGAF